MNINTNINWEVDIKKFKKLGRLNQGAFGIVYKVEQKETGNIYAAKYIDCKDNEEICDKVINKEVKIMINANHPTIVKIMGYSKLDFLDDNNLIIIMQYAENGSLAKILENIQNGIGPYNYDNTIRQIILTGIARGMKYLHDRNVIPRDLKTDNILLDNEFHPLITDFGLSKFFEVGHSYSQSINCGSLIYKAPEILRNASFGIKADVYSFGIVMYEVITDSVPYPELENNVIADFEFKEKVTNHKYRPEFGFHVKESIKELIEQCWSDDPSKRPTFTEVFNKLCQKEYYLDDVDEEQLQIYIDDITEIKDPIDKLQKKIEEYECKINDLNAEKKQLATEKEQLTTENEQLTTENEQLTTENERLTTKNEQLTTETEQLTTENEQLTTENEQLTTEKVQLTTEKVQLTTENEKLNSEKDLLIISSNNLKKDASQKDSLITQLQYVLDDIEKKYRITLDEVELLREEIQRYRTNPNNSRTNNASIRIQSLEDKNRKLRTEIEKNKEDNRKMENEYMSIISSFQKALASKLIVNINDFEIGECLPFTSQRIEPSKSYYSIRKKADENPKMECVITFLKCDLQYQGRNIFSLGHFASNVLSHEILNHYSIMPLIGCTALFNEYTYAVITKFMKNGSLDMILRKAAKSLFECFSINWETFQATTIFGIAAGMAYVHQNRIIHRNLKASNILFDDDLSPKISGFGSSIIVTQEDEENRVLLNCLYGAPINRAPELINEDYAFYTNKVDVFAFGMLLYQIFTCKIPFENDKTNVQRFESRIKNGERPELTDSIFHHFSQLITRCWSQNPQSRPSFIQIVRDLMENQDEYFDFIMVDENYFLDFVDKAIEGLDLGD